MTTIYVYEGRWEDAGHRLTATTYDLQTGLGHYIRGKQQKISQKDDLVVLLKPLPAASYQTVLAALDEMQINDVKKYALVDASAEEIFATRRP